MSDPVYTEDELLQFNRLRRDVGASEDVLTNDIAKEYMDEAEEEYPDNLKKARMYARVIALQGIRASSAMLGKYAQNQHQEDLTKVFDNLTEMLRDFEAKVGLVSDAPVESVGNIFFTVATGRRGQ